MFPKLNIKWNTYTISIAILIGILFIALLYHTYSSTIEGFNQEEVDISVDKKDEAGSSSLTDNISDLERELQMASAIETNLSEIEVILAQSTLTESQLNRITDLYKDYFTFVNQYRKIINRIDSSIPTNELGQVNNLSKLLSKGRESLNRYIEIQQRIQTKLGALGYNIAHSDCIKIVKITTPVEPVTANSDVIVEELSAQIRKLQEINEENISYYKKLNVDQQTILLEIINKRNGEIKELQLKLAQCVPSDRPQQEPNVFPIPLVPTTNNNGNTNTKDISIFPPKSGNSDDKNADNGEEDADDSGESAPNLEVPVPVPVAVPIQVPIQVPVQVINERQPPYIGPSPYPAQCCATDCCGKNKPQLNQSMNNRIPITEPHRIGKMYQYPYPFAGYGSY